jgi:hypothetical protein
MGKSSEDIKKMAKKETAKSPISPIWLGMRRATPSLFPFRLQFSPNFGQRESAGLIGHVRPTVLLAFVVFGGIIFEVLSRIFFGSR